jgi:hypothetical protein
VSFRGLASVPALAALLLFRPAAASAEEQAERAGDEADSSAFMLRAGAGAFYTKIFSVSSFGGEGFFGLGASGERFAWDGGMHLAKGTTLHGLGILKWRVAFSFEWPVGVLRLGLGPSVGYLSMQSATYVRDEPQARANEPLRQLSLGAEGHASVDLIRLSSLSTLFLRGSFQVESGAYGPMLGLGYRWVSWPPGEE